MFNRIDNAINWIAGLAVAAMIVHICADVVGKFILNTPVPGTIAIVTNYYMPIITFLPLAFIQRSDGHIVVDVATNQLPERVRYHLISWTLLFSAVVFGILTVYTAQEAYTKYLQNIFIIEDQTRIATWPGLLCPPIGYAMITILLVLQFYQYLVGVPHRKPDHA